MIAIEKIRLSSSPHFYDQRRRMLTTSGYSSLPYAPITQNARVERIRVGSDEDLKVVALDQSMDADNLKTVIEAAYRQIFFHAFKSDRDRFLESQLRNGQITVRDFIRGLCLSDTFTRTFYGFNSNYKVVRHLVERLLGARPAARRELPGRS